MCVYYHIAVINLKYSTRKIYLKLSLMNGSVNNFDAGFFLLLSLLVYFFILFGVGLTLLSYLRFIDVKIGVPMFVNSWIPEQFIYLAND